MADITVSAASVAGVTRGMRNVVFVSQYVGYWFQIGTNTDLFYCKTTDGGKTWGAEVSIKADTLVGFDVWYDQWTPGDTGRNIHIWMFYSTTDEVKYNRLNTVNDALAGETMVLDIASAVAGRGTFISGTKTRGGNLYCAFDVDAGAEKGLYRSTDNGATWGSRTDPIDASLDQCKLFPANAADSQDMWMLFHDATNNVISVKTHDDSANTNSESSTLAMTEEGTDTVGQYGFDGSIRHSDGHLIFAYMDAYDAAGASDFKVYDFDGTNLTALTDIATNVDSIYYPSVFLNQDQPDWIYVAYLGVTAGTSTLTTSMPVLYALSKDRGVSWTKDIAYSTSTTDYAHCWAPNNGEKFQVFWYDISGTDIITNHDNSKDFGFTPLNNYQAPRAVGQNNTGVMQVAGRG